MSRAHFLEISVYRRFRASATKATAIADYVNTLTGHNNKWDHFDILASGKTDYHCKIKETLLIQELKPAFNVHVKLCRNDFEGGGFSFLGLWLSFSTHTSKTVEILNCFARPPRVAVLFILIHCGPWSDITCFSIDCRVISFLAKTM